MRILGYSILVCAIISLTGFRGLFDFLSLYQQVRIHLAFQILCPVCRIKPVCCIRVAIGVVYDMYLSVIAHLLYYRSRCGEFTPTSGTWMSFHLAHKYITWILTEVFCFLEFF